MLIFACFYWTCCVSKAIFSQHTYIFYLNQQRRPWQHGQIFVSNVTYHSPLLSRCRTGWYRGGEAVRRGTEGGLMLRWKAVIKGFDDSTRSQISNSIEIIVESQHFFPQATKPFAKLFPPTSNFSETWGFHFPFHRAISQAIKPFALRTLLIKSLNECDLRIYQWIKQKSNAHGAR